MANRAVHPPILLHPGCMRAIAVGVSIRYLGRMKIDNARLMSWKFGADSILAASTLTRAPGPGNSPTKKKKRNFDGGALRAQDDIVVRRSCVQIWIEVREGEEVMPDGVKAT
jgi:hypothetical protein